MQGAGRRNGPGKSAGASREARLAAKLRQNLTRRKVKARARDDETALRIEREVGPDDDNGERG